MVFRYWIPIVLVCLGSCGTKKPVTSQAPQPILELPEIVEIEEVDPDLEPTPWPKYLILRLEKTDCYGKCPSYIAEVYSDGTATFEGKANVEKIGTFEAQMPRRQIKTIQDQAANFNFFELDTIYPSNNQLLPDLPSTITLVAFDEDQHRIHHNYGAPKALKKFEAFLEEMIGSMDWK